MSTKRLSRSIREQGRPQYYKVCHKKANRQTRHFSKRNLKNTLRDLDLCDSIDFHKEFRIEDGDYDYYNKIDGEYKLPFKLIQKYIDKPIEELKQKFNKENIPEDILFSFIEKHLGEWAEFYIDEDGLVQDQRRRRWKQAYLRTIPDYLVPQGWRMGKRGDKYYWFELVEYDGLDRNRWWRYRQSYEMSKKDIEYVLSLYPDTFTEANKLLNIE